MRNNTIESKARAFLGTISPERRKRYAAAARAEGMTLEKWAINGELLLAGRRPRFTSPRVRRLDIPERFVFAWMPRRAAGE